MNDLEALFAKIEAEGLYAELQMISKSYWRARVVSSLSDLYVDGGVRFPADTAFEALSDAYQGRM